MIKTNQQYFDWLDKIKAAFQQTVDNTTVDAELAIWEQSLIIAKICHDYKYNPQNINWNDIDCNTKKNNLYLDNFKRTYQIDLVIH